MDFSINQSIFTGVSLLTLSKKTFKNALKKIPRDAFCSSHVRDVFLISVAKHVQTCSKRVSDYTYPRQVVRRSRDNNSPLNCNPSRFWIEFHKIHILHNRAGLTQEVRASYKIYKIQDRLSSVQHLLSYNH